MSQAEAIHAHCRIAAILIGKDKLAEAIVEFGKAADLAKDPSKAAWLYNQIGNLLEQLGRTDDAMTAFRRAAALGTPAPDPKPSGA